MLRRGLRLIAGRLMGRMAAAGDADSYDTAVILLIERR